jgi:nicotinamide riboside transporter PnuC
MPDSTTLLASHAGLATALQIVAVVCGLLGQLLLAMKRRSAFWIWIVSNAALMTLNAALHLWWLVALYAAYTSLCALSLWTWRSQRGSRRNSRFRLGGRDPLDLTIAPPAPSSMAHRR